MQDPPWLDSFGDRIREWTIALSQQAAPHPIPSVQLMVLPLDLPSGLPNSIPNSISWGCDWENLINTMPK